MPKRDISRFGYGNDDTRYLDHQQQEHSTPEELKAKVARLKELAKTDPSVRPALEFCEKKLESLALNH